jgi:16S rRNA (guanine1516-N2)-methyltransferase
MPDITLSIAVSVDNHNKDRGHNLAMQLALPLCAGPGNNQTIQQCSSFDFVFIYNKGKGDELPILALSGTDETFGGPIFVDFVGGKAGHRRRFGGGRGQPLARAIGLKAGINPVVFDVTAGLGKDAFVLSCLGAQVMLIERSTILAALLKDGMERALSNPDVKDIVSGRMSLLNVDAIDWLSHIDKDQRPDVIYMDPMYPHRNKSALVKKEMRYLREIVGDDVDAGQLLQVALTCAKRRVVVKRPRNAPILDNPSLNHRTPDTTVESKNTRYDIYFTQS